MDVLKKRPNKYVTAVYAVFIILLVFTGTLFYTSRCQNYPPTMSENDAMQNFEVSKESPPKVTNKVYITKELSQDTTAELKSKPVGDDELVDVQPSKKDPTVESETRMDHSKTPTGQAVEPNADSTRGLSAAISFDRSVEIYFATDSTGLTKEALAKLKTVVLFLLKFPEAEIIIKGYGDTDKKYRHNTRLSQLRADIVKNYLIRHGTASARIQAFWIGSESPTAENVLQDDPNKTHLVEIMFKTAKQ